MPEQDIKLEAALPMIRACLERGQTVTFSPQGTSMLPMLRQGRDQVTLGPLPERLKKYDLPLYRRRDGSYVLHRVLKAGDTYTMIGDNQFVYEPGIGDDQLIAMVTAFVRNGRTVSVRAWHYRLYCRLWHYSRPVRKLWRRVINGIRRRLPKRRIP